MLGAVRMNSLGFGGRREKRERGGDERKFGDGNKHWMIPQRQCAYKWHFL
jgi:hypothetical protein